MGNQRATSQADTDALRPLPPGASLDLAPFAEEGHLITRQASDDAVNAIIARLSDMPPGGVLIVDLSGLRQVSSTAMLALGYALATARTAAFDDRYLLFRLDMDNRDLVEALALVARDSGDTVPVVGLSGPMRAIGRLPKAERDTLELVLERGELTAAELREHCRLMSSAASNRLRWLYLKRLVRRDERVIAGTGGREFVYRPITME